MKPPLFVRPLTPAERSALARGRRSREAFTLRRAQILLASAAGRTPPTIAAVLGCSDQAVRNVIRAFARDGLGCLTAKPPVPRRPVAAWDRRHDENLKDLLHRSPREFGRSTSLWTPGAAAAVCHQRGWTPRVLTGEAIRQTLRRLGVRWKRAKHWITSPDPEYARKKKLRDRLIDQAGRHPDWVLGFQDETWWTRRAQPNLFAWTAADPLRLSGKARAKDGPQAVACYGVLRADTGGMMLRFVTGRPVSQVTEDFLGWVCQALAAEGKEVFVLVWDNASWHVSRRVRRWIDRHNRRVRKEGGCRIRVCGLPVKAPWLNPIEPKWMHGKRAVVEPARKLSADELRQRVCDYFGSPRHEPLTQQAA
ncbi:MAG: Is630 family transposase [Gemmataceae bacterium]|nr:Is630 family transposase [Gemmataceae bacterium]